MPWRLRNRRCPSRCRPAARTRELRATRADPCLQALCTRSSVADYLPQCPYDDAEILQEGALSDVLDPQGVLYRAHMGLINTIGFVVSEHRTELVELDGGVVRDPGTNGQDESV